MGNSSRTIWEWDIKNNGILRLQYDNGDYSFSGLLCDCMGLYGSIFSIWELNYKSLVDIYS
jgi:hypothetical protein